MSIVGNLKRFKRRQDFFPGFVGLFTNPFYFARKGLYRSVAALAPKIDGEILDVGCGRKPYLELFKYTRYVGLDMENPGHSHENENIDVFYDGKTFPLADASFDNALCNQVLEHVFEPDYFLGEINRILRPNGKLLLTVPFAWDEHEQPNDYARYSSFGLKALLSRNGFEIVEFRKSVNDVRALFQLVNCYLQKKTYTGKYALDMFLVLILISPLNILGEIIGRILPRNDDLYLDNVVLARKKQK